MRTSRKERRINTTTHGAFTGKFGVEIGAKYGTGNSINMGSYLGTPGGIFSGYNINTSVANTFALPISSQVDYKRSGPPIPLPLRNG